MNCPNCGLINPETALMCDCGYDFPSRVMKGSYLDKAFGTKQGTINAKRAGAIKYAMYSVFMIGSIYLLVGSFGNFKILDIGNSPSWEIVVGLVYLVLGFSVRQKRANALALAIVITASLLLWSLISSCQTISTDEGLAFFRVALHGGCLRLMVGGYKPLSALERYPNP
jgi:hypothetical protein